MRRNFVVQSGLYAERRKSSSASTTMKPVTSFDTSSDNTDVHQASSVLLKNSPKSHRPATVKAHAGVPSSICEIRTWNTFMSEHAFFGSEAADSAHITFLPDACTRLMMSTTRSFALASACRPACRIRREEELLDAHFVTKWTIFSDSGVANFQDCRRRAMESALRSWSCGLPTVLSSSLIFAP